MQISWHNFHVLYTFLEIGLLGFHVSKAHQTSTLAQNQNKKFITIIYDLMVVYSSIITSK
jgi:hypothetical protein